MKKILLTLITISFMTACETKNVKDWSDKEIDDWFDKSIWQGLAIKPDNSIDKRAFVEQNILNPASWEAACQFLQKGGFNEKELGEYKLADDGTFVNIQEYTTKDSSHFEAHRKYIDIQYLSKGKEYIRVTSLDNIVNQVSPYDEAKDIEFYDKDEYTEHLLDGSNFIVLFPHEGHMPCMQVDSAMHVRKIVLKIPVAK